MYMLSINTEVSYINVLPPIILEVFVDLNPRFPLNKIKITSQI